MTEPLVSCILVNYFSETHTLNCVRSIAEKTKGVSYEIRVVDNHSGLKAETLTAQNPEIVFIAADCNLGFGAACTLAAQDARGQYLFFLNNDCQLINDAASLLAAFLESHSDTALVGAQLFSPTGQRVPSFDYFPTISTKLLGTTLLRRWAPHRYPSKRVDYKDPLEVDLVAGACLFIRADLFRSLGGFDPQFFLYCEEEDLALRVRALGHNIYLIPEAQVMHIGGGSSTPGPALKREFYISFFKLYRKHYGHLKTVILKSICLIQFFLKYLRQDDKEVWLSLLKWLAQGAPAQESIRYLAERQS